MYFLSSGAESETRHHSTAGGNGRPTRMFSAFMRSWKGLSGALRFMKMKFVWLSRYSMPSSSRVLQTITRASSLALREFGMKSLSSRSTSAAAMAELLSMMS